jgi:iron complex outermembrane receptor protein
MKHISSAGQTFSLLLLSALLPIHSIAQQGDAQSVTEADIIVSGTRSEHSSLNIPASITVIYAEEITGSGAGTLSDALRGHAGLQVNDRYGDGSTAVVDMRGFGESAASNTLVMVDGRRLNNTDISAPDISSVSLKDIERIEIINGSAGALFGDQAVGGVINIITRDPDSFKADVKLSSGSYSRRNLRVSVADRLAGGFNYRVSAESLSSDNYRDHNAIDYGNLFARAGFIYGSGKVFVELQSIEEDAEQPGALMEADAIQDRRQSLPDFENDFNNTSTDLTRFGMQQDIGRHWLFAVEYAEEESDTDFILNFNGCAMFVSCAIEADNEVREQQTLTPRFIGRYDTGSGDLLLTIGADAIKSEYEIAGDAINRSNDQEIESVYLQAVVPVSRRFSYTIAGRQAKVENYLVDTGGVFGPGTYPAGVDIEDDVTVGSFGITIKPTTAWRIFARLDQNFRFAKLDEQVFTETGTVGLRTQTGDSAELGTEWRSESGHHARLVAWQLDLENEIGFDPTADGPWGPGTGANVNFASTERRGLILEGRVQVIDALAVAGSWAEVDAEFTAGIYSGNTVSAAADHIASVSTEAQFNDNWQGYLQFQRIGEQFLAGDNDNLLPRKDAYNVANLNLRYAPGSWAFNARINNLLDREYSESENAFGAISPSPERNFWLGAEYRYE